MDFLYAELKRNLDGVIKLTEGLTTETAVTTVDNDAKTIKVDVLGCPGTFNIQLDSEGTEVVHYNGSTDVLLNLYNIISQYVKIVDIVDNLNSDSSDKPLSAKQGKALKNLFEQALLNYYTKSEITELLSHKQDTLTFDDSPIQGSSNPVKSGGIFAELETKQDNLTFDSTPTESSVNPVTSGGIFTALQNYVVKTRTIAGLSLENDIDADSLVNSLFNVTSVIIEDN